MCSEGHYGIDLVGRKFDVVFNPKVGHSHRSKRCLKNVEREDDLGSKMARYRLNEFPCLDILGEGSGFGCVVACHATIHMKQDCLDPDWALRGRLSLGSSIET